MSSVQKIRGKLISYTVAILIPAFLSLGLITYWQSQAVIRDFSDETALVAARQGADSLASWITGKTSETAVIAASPLITGTNTEAARRYLKQENERLKDYDVLFVADKTGNYFASRGREGDIRDRQYYQEVMTTGRTVITNPLINRATETLVVIIATPIIRDGEVCGIFGADINFNEFSQRVKSFRFGKTGYAYVVQKDGLIIAHPNDEFAMKYNPLQDENLESENRAAVRRMVQGEPGTSLYTFQGVEKKAIYIPIRGTDWSLVVSVPTSELTGAARSLSMTFVLTAGGILLLALCLILLAVRRITGPLLMVGEAARALAQGRLDSQALWHLETAAGKDTMAEDIKKIHQELQLQIERLQLSKKALETDIIKRKAAETALTELNERLEHKVEERTAELMALNQELTAMNEEMQAMNMELIDTNSRLQEEIAEREKAQEKLQQLIQELKLMQNHLIQSEKMSSLGTLVTGVAHEINTPVGVALTAASYLEKITEGFREQPAPSPAAIAEYLEESVEAVQLIRQNLQRSIQLVNSFKQVSIDQNNQSRRIFNVRQYLEEIMISVRPQMRKTSPVISIECDEHLYFDTVPGLFSQIIAQLAMNSAQHAFDTAVSRQIVIQAEEQDNGFVVIFKDNGKGMDIQTLGRIFDPFFTTRRGGGNVGLGLFMVYNLVVQQLKGTIRCESMPGAGTVFYITLPK